MKLAAVVPALFVLISLCGSPVPAPPGSVSGVAFYDANRNGIHDSCDRPLALATVVATAADGKAETSTSGPDGAFHIDKVDLGLALVTLAAPDGEVWHTTTATADGVLGAAVEVKDLRDTGGVEIGATSPSPMSATQISVSGVIFNDANGNGQIDKDECGIPQSWANLYGTETKIGGPAIASGPSGDGTYFVYGLDAARTVHPNLPDPGWVATTGGTGDQPCSRGVVPTSWHGTTVYEANIGFKRGTITSSVSGALFDDANSNGLRDREEGGLPNVALSLEPSGGNCGAYSPGNATTGPDGTFAFHNVQPGVYLMRLGGPQMPVRQPVSQVVTLGQPQQQIAVGKTDVTADIAATIQPAAYAVAWFFADANGNKQWDADEGTVFNYIYACLSTGASVPDLTGGIDTLTPSPGQCASSDGGGLAQIGPVPEGDYSLFVWDQYAPPPTAPTLTGLHLSASSPVSINVPVAPQPTPTPPPPRPTVVASPEAIPSGGAAQTMTVCYSNPGWVQPPFEHGYGTPYSFGDWPPVDDARKMYSHGIYVTGLSQEWYVWATIAGLLDWVFAPAPGGCTFRQEPSLTIDLAGYEPLKAVSKGNVEQITLTKHETGLYAIQLPQSPKNSQRWNLFVDESNRPLARCNSFSLQCEWFN